MTLVYGRLPEHYRAADQTLGHPLERYCAGAAAPLADVLAELDRIADLGDPYAIDASRLPWLAQLVGVRVDGLPVDQARSLVAGGAGTPGSLRSVRAAVEALLTGSRHVELVRHYGDDWTVAIITLTGETPVDGTEVVAAANVEKPGGVRFVHDFGLTWSELEAGYPTWEAIEAAGSWGALVP